jgi:uncharacterized protein YecE (DUF72 family)
MVPHVTHNYNNETPEEDSLKALRTFCDNIALLENNLGPILFQFSRTKRIQFEDIQKMAAVIEESDLPVNAKIALDLRHVDFIRNSAVIQELRRLKWSGATPRQCWSRHCRSLTSTRIGIHVCSFATLG